jgi:hypothetical protein
MNAIEKSCKSCPLISGCEYVGSSPLIKGDKKYYCRIIGGLAKRTVDESILSEESRIKYERNGPYLNIVEIPFKGPDDEILYNIGKVFVRSPNG